MMRMEIRKAKANDIGLLKSLAKRVISHNYAPFLGIDNVNMFIASGQSDKEIEDGIDNCFVMLKANHIVGFAIIYDSCCI